MGLINLTRNKQLLTHYARVKGGFQLEMRVIARKKMRVWGMDSRTLDCRHVLFWDYDDCQQDRVIEDLRYLQEKYQLAEIYVFKSRPEVKTMVSIPECCIPEQFQDKKAQTIEVITGSYHAFCLDKCSLYEANSILADSQCDYAFKKGARVDMSRSWTLRTFADEKRGKPEYVCTLESPYHEREQSSSHIAFVNRIYGLGIKAINPDNIPKMIIKSWLTEPTH